MADTAQDQVDKTAEGLSRLIPEIEGALDKFKSLDSYAKRDMLYDACVDNVLKMTLGGEAKIWICDWFARREEHREC